MQSPHLDGWEICWIVTGPPRGPPHPTLTIKYSVGLPGIVKASQPRTSQFHPNFTSIQPKHLQIHNCKSLKNSTWKERKKERNKHKLRLHTLCGHRVTAKAKKRNNFPTWAQRGGLHTPLHVIARQASRRLPGHLRPRTKEVCRPAGLAFCH